VDLLALIVFMIMKLGYGRPWIKYTWTTECVRIIDPESRPPEAYCYLKKIGQSWYSLGDNAEPGCPNCGSRKTGYLASGQCDPTVSGGFYKVCCKPDGTVGVSNVYAGDTVNPPYESVCTVGQATFLISVPELGIYQPPEANTTEPNSGEPHPACKGWFNHLHLSSFWKSGYFYCKFYAKRNNKNFNWK
jgi:hypothetical protein